LAGAGADHCLISACTKVMPGASLRAFSSISADESTPVTWADGQRSASRRVMLPGPQPRS
jgi:hypothetical protein